MIEGYDDGFDVTSPVGSFPAGVYGALDMSGNVWEWTADWYDSAYDRPAPSRNPTGPVTGSLRVIRGGGFSSDDAAVLRASDRGNGAPSLTSFVLGFRCAAPASP
jgi:sulfatase modifying factor 1